MTLTSCHCSPVETPARLCTPAISGEHDLDGVAYACHGGGQGGAATRLQQGCSVSVCDCQVVIPTGGMILNVE